MKKIEIFLKNILLRILLVFSGRKNEKNQENQNKFKSTLFIRLNRIGDALVSTPLLHEIKKNVGCRVYLLPDIDELIVFNKGIKGISEVLKFIKEHNIDTVVDLHDDVSTTVSFIVALSKAKNKFGLKKDNEIIYTKTVEKPDHTKIHVVDRQKNPLKLQKIF